MRSGPEPPDRLRLIAAAGGGAGGPEARERFARDVAGGLTASPKRLHCRYFYDREGSLLFEEICELPEYYLTRAEDEILEARTGEILAALPEGVGLVELGSGSAAKTRRLIAALLARQDGLLYAPVDISTAMLEDSSRALLREHARLRIAAVAGDYTAGQEWLEEVREGPLLLLWLGSNVGNFHRPEAAAFLRGLAGRLSAGDRLLVGIDLRKDRAVLERAYDDARGVTARFNRNILRRINRELGGRFDPGEFDHRAVWDEEAGRIEMHLVSRSAVTVPIEAIGLEVPFAAGEGIHTENSYKYSPGEIDALAAASGLAVERRWLDAGALFSLSLLAPAQRS